MRYEHFLHSILLLIDSEDINDLKSTLTLLLPLVLDSEREKQRIERNIIQTQARFQFHNTVVQQISRNHSAGYTTGHSAPAA